MSVSRAVLDSIVRRSARGRRAHPRPDPAPGRRRGRRRAGDRASPATRPRSGSTRRSSSASRSTRSCTTACSPPSSRPPGRGRRRRRRSPTNMARNAMAHLSTAASSTPFDESHTSSAPLRDRLVAAIADARRRGRRRAPRGSRTTASRRRRPRRSTAPRCRRSSTASQHAGDGPGVRRWIDLAPTADGGAEVEVGDTGAGFDPAAVPERAARGARLDPRAGRNAGGRRPDRLGAGPGTDRPWCASAGRPSTTRRRRPREGHGAPVAHRGARRGVLGLPPRARGGLARRVADPVPVVACMALYGVATVVVLWPSRQPAMPVWLAGFALAVVVVVPLLVTSQLDPHRAGTATPPGTSPPSAR